MKLYYATGACSLSPHIVLNELGSSFDLEKVDLATKKTEHGEDFVAINPKGYVPALMLNDATVLTEGVAIIQYLADQAPDAALVPKAGTVARGILQGHLNYLSAELHKSFGPLFNPNSSDTERAQARKNVLARYDYLETVLTANGDWLLKDRFTVADIYMFVLVNWSAHCEIDLAGHPNIAKHRDRVLARPATQQALKAEGLI
ncbi:glutathione transferase GstA [Thalassospira sp.]|uniref:glutathione transferase GstA n=1 Tax=Thalassospira sp. TaxID=1912094 RepID=UPI0032F08CA3